MRIAVLLPAGPGADDAVLRLALSLAQGRDDTEIVAVRAGAPAAEAPADEAALSRALALGAHRAVRVWDEALPGVDYLWLATVLAGVVRALGCRLVIAGDRGLGAVGPAVAERLDLPHLCGVLSASLSAESPDPGEPAEGGDGPLWVRRRILLGIQRLRGPAEAVLCVLSTAADPLLPSAPAGPERRVEAWGLEQAGLKSAQLVHRRRLGAAAGARAARTSRPLGFDSAGALIGRLRQDGLLHRQ